MTFFKNTENWFKGEVFEGGMLLIFGTLLVILSVYFWKFGHTPTASVLVIPFLVIGLFLEHRCRGRAHTEHKPPGSLPRGAQEDPH